MDAQEGFVVDHGEGFGGGDADHERADEARGTGGGDRGDVFPA